MQSLLGHFYSRIKGSQEDIASEGLTYILQRSKSARLAINKLIKADFNLNFQDLNYTTQRSGENLERPDISGHNMNGQEVLIIEAKFWSSLTENQPIEYLNRLTQNAALIFICPSLRVRIIFDEILKRIKAEQIKYTANLEMNSIYFENNKYLSVKTWDAVLGIVRDQLVDANENQFISDINQIKGFCDTIDTNTFLPIKSHEMSPVFARRINSYYDLLVNVVGELKKNEILNTNGLSSTGQKRGFTQYLKTGKLGVSFNIKFDYWAQYADSPFWLSFGIIPDVGNWITTPDLRKACKEVAFKNDITIYETNYNDIFFAIKPMLDKTEDIVIKDMTSTIKLIVTGIKNSLKLE